MRDLGADGLIMPTRDEGDGPRVHAMMPTQRLNCTTADGWAECHRCKMPGTTHPPASATLAPSDGVFWCKNGRDCAMRYKRQRRQGQ